MAHGCCGTPHAPEAFTCHGCGQCCTDLRDRWHAARGRFSPVPGTAMVRLPAPQGLRLFPWEARRFPSDRLEPLLAVPCARRERLVALAYVLGEDTCPHYEDGCTIHADRPLVCRAYPLLVVEGSDGPEVAASALCPARVPVTGAVSVSARPHEVLARLYPHEAAAALAVPHMVRRLGAVLDFLESADLLTPRVLDEEQVEAWLTRGTVDLLDVLEEGGAFPPGMLEAEVQDVLERAPGTRG